MLSFLSISIREYCIFLHQTWGLVNIGRRFPMPGPQRYPLDIFPLEDHLPLVCYGLLVSASFHKNPPRRWSVRVRNTGYVPVFKFSLAGKHLKEVVS